MSLAAPTIESGVLDELRAILGEDGAVLTGRSARLNRARVPAPFPVHRWAEHGPDVVVLPRTAQQVSEIVKLANRPAAPAWPMAPCRCAAESCSMSSGWTRSRRSTWPTAR